MTEREGKAGIPTSEDPLPLLLPPSIYYTGPNAFFEANFDQIIIYDMQLTQSIRSNSYAKGVSNDIIFTLYISCTINLVNSQMRF